MLPDPGDDLHARFSAVLAVPERGGPNSAVFQEEIALIYGLPLRYYDAGWRQVDPPFATK